LVAKHLVIDVLFLFFTGTTLVIMLLFLIEGLLMYHKLNPKYTKVMA